MALPRSHKFDGRLAWALLLPMEGNLRGCGSSGDDDDDHDHDDYDVAPAA